MTTDKLIAHFDKYLPLGEKEKDALRERVIERKVKRRQFILQENDICRHYTFVISGCFKMYGVDRSGAEHNIQFACEDEWIADIGSFHSDKPSRLYIEAIEPSVILQIERANLIFLYSNYKFDRNFRIFIENSFVELQNRVLQNLSSTAEERYLAFLDQYSKLAARLPNTEIASYIGITPEFLSKVRSNIAKK